jgi:hypothetical protein
MSKSDFVFRKLETLRWDPRMDGSAEICPASEASESPSEASSKECPECHENLAVDAFYVCASNKDGRQNLCKKCFQQTYKGGKKAESEPQAYKGGKKTETEQQVSPDALYIMENPRIPGEVKIGRSTNPEERAKALSAGNNFRLVVKQTYDEKGFLEKTLHNRLKRRRVEEGAGIEWFGISVEQADLLIRAAILEDELSKE